MIQMEMSDMVTAVCLGNKETDKVTGQEFRILALCTENDEKIEIRLPIGEHELHLFVIGDAKRITDFI